MNDGESLLLRNVTTILEYIQLPPIGSSHLREVEKKMRHSNHRIEVGESNRYSTIYLYDERHMSQLMRYRSVASNGLKKNTEYIINRITSLLQTSHRPQACSCH